MSVRAKRAHTLTSRTHSLTLMQDSVNGSPRGVRDSLMSYLLSCSHPASDSPQDPRNVDTLLPVDTLIGPLTPPSSYTPYVNIPQYVVNPLERRPSLPLTPASAPNVQPITQSLPNKTATATASSTPSPTSSHTALLGDLFPSQASAMDGRSYALELVTPPDHIIHGFVLDQQLYGRSVYIHLRPPHSSSNRAEGLAANFSEVLRPHDPSRLAGASDDMAEVGALDIRESLTALLDLASDSLNAKNLVLVLDKSDRESAGLDELLHSLMYAGGQVVRPSLLEGGWEWDASRWILVGMEL